MEASTKSSVEAVIASCVNRAIVRVKKVLAKASYRPFHKALLTEALVKASVFERSFSTSFGQGPVEAISEAIARDAGAEATRGRDMMITIQNAKMDAISDILANLRAKKDKPNWDSELARVAGAQSNATVTIKVRSDLWIKKDGQECYFSIKTVKPNLDQTEIAKRDMLTLKASDPSCQVFFGLYYNPSGERREDYDWKIPFKIFDMKKDPCVLIGREYWDFLGGVGTYDELLELFSKVGEETRKSLEAI